MAARAELAGKVAVVTGVTRRAGLGAAIARELVEAGAAVFVTHFREYDRRQTWGVAPGEPESILAALGEQGAGIELDLSSRSAAADVFNQLLGRLSSAGIVAVFHVGRFLMVWEGGNQHTSAGNRGFAP